MAANSRRGKEPSQAVVLRSLLDEMAFDALRDPNINEERTLAVFGADVIESRAPLNFREEPVADDDGRVVLRPVTDFAAAFREDDDSPQRTFGASPRKFASFNGGTDAGDQPSSLGTFTDRDRPPVFGGGERSRVRLRDSPETAEALTLYSEAVAQRARFNLLPEVHRGLKGYVKEMGAQGDFGRKELRHFAERVTDTVINFIDGATLADLAEVPGYRGRHGVSVHEVLDKWHAQLNPGRDDPDRELPKYQEIIRSIADSAGPSARRLTAAASVLTALGTGPLIHEVAATDAGKAPIAIREVESSSTRVVRLREDPEDELSLAARIASTTDLATPAARFGRTAQGKSIADPGKEDTSATKIAEGTKPAVLTEGDTAPVARAEEGAKVLGNEKSAPVISGETAAPILREGSSPSASSGITENTKSPVVNPDAKAPVLSPMVDDADPTVVTVTLDGPAPPIRTSVAETFIKAEQDLGGPIVSIEDDTLDDLAKVFASMNGEDRAAYLSHRGVSTTGTLRQIEDTDPKSLAGLVGLAKLTDTYTGDRGAVVIATLGEGGERPETRIQMSDGGTPDAWVGENAEDAQQLGRRIRSLNDRGYAVYVPDGLEEVAGVEITEPQSKTVAAAPAPAPVVPVVAAGIPAVTGAGTGIGAGTGAGNSAGSEIGATHPIAAATTRRAPSFGDAVRLSLGEDAAPASATPAAPAVVPTVPAAAPAAPETPPPPPPAPPLPADMSGLEAWTPAPNPPEGPLRPTDADWVKRHRFEIAPYVFGRFQNEVSSYKPVTVDQANEIDEGLAPAINPGSPLEARLIYMFNGGIGRSPDMPEGADPAVFHQTELVFKGVISLFESSEDNPEEVRGDDGIGGSYTFEQIYQMPDDDGYISPDRDGNRILSDPRIATQKGSELWTMGGGSRHWINSTKKAYAAFANNDEYVARTLEAFKNVFGRDAQIDQGYFSWLQDHEPTTVPGDTPVEEWMTTGATGVVPTPPPPPPPPTLVAPMAPAAPSGGTPAAGTPIPPASPAAPGAGQPVSGRANFAKAVAATVAPRTPATPAESTGSAPSTAGPATTTASTTPATPATQAPASTTTAPPATTTTAPAATTTAPAAPGGAPTTTAPASAEVKAAAPASTADTSPPVPESVGLEAGEALGHMTESDFSAYNARAVLVGDGSLRGADKTGGLLFSLRGDRIKGVADGDAGRSITDLLDGDKLIKKYAKELGVSGHVVFAFGYNDIGNMTPEEFKEEMERAIEAVHKQSAGAKVYFVRLVAATSDDKTRDEFNTAAEESGAIMIDATGVAGYAGANLSGITPSVYSGLASKITESVVAGQGVQSAAYAALHSGTPATAAPAATPTAPAAPTPPVVPTPTPEAPPADSNLPALGEPDGNGNVMVPDAPNNEWGFWWNTPEGDRCGSVDTVKNVMILAKMWHQKHPDKPLWIGDLDAAGHLSHRNGRDVDIYTEQSSTNLYYDVPTFMSPEDAIEFFVMAASMGVWELWFYNDEGVRNAVNEQVGNSNYMQEWPLHNNHGHGRLKADFASSPAEGCA